MKVLILGYVWPELCSSAAGLRTWNIVDACLKSQWSVAFASVAQTNTHTQALKDRGVHVVSVQMNDPQFNGVLKEIQPDLVLFDRFMTEEQFGWRVREVCPHAARIVDTIDLHSLRRARQKAIVHGRSLEEARTVFEFTPVPMSEVAKPKVSQKSDFQQQDREIYDEDFLRELAAILRSDSTLILSDYELQLLTEQFQINPEILFLSRFHYGVVPENPFFEERSGFVMIGNFRHPPNADGVRWFASKIWPKIRAQLPEVQVRIYGAYPPREFMTMTDAKKGFFVEGSVPEAYDVLARARVNLAPLRFGAGIKGKITEGWWAGTPVVTTPMGAEGMSESFDWGGAVVSDQSADVEQDFADACVRLYQEKTLWQEKQKAGYAILTGLYSESQNAERLILHFQKVVENLHVRRRQNIVSSVLNFQLHQGTKYFSKWIETKTRVKVLEESLASGRAAAPRLSTVSAVAASMQKPTVNWAPFRVGAMGELLPPPRAMDTVAGIGDRLRAAAFAELQARDAFRWAADVLQDAPPGLAEAWRRLAIEEEKHMNSLLGRMRDLEIDLEERPVSDRLWNSLMSCTTARDFAVYMASAEERGQRAGFKFHQALAQQDPVSAQIFLQIAQEETAHIALAKQYF